MNFENSTKPESITGPELIKIRDIQSDLHVHSSEGSPDAIYNIQQLARFYHETGGLKYFAVTNHFYSENHFDEVRSGVSEALKEFPDMQILHGLELNIAPDGSIKVPDDIGDSQLNIASIHKEPSQNISSRILSAIQNPYVDIIGHPGRFSKESFDTIDWESLCAELAEKDKAVELNVSELYPILSGEVDSSGESVYLLQTKIFQAIKRYSTKISIGSDMHDFPNVPNAESLGMGWRKVLEVINFMRSCGVTRDQVVNTMSHDELLLWAQSHRND